MENKELTITVTPEELEIIGKGLAELPYRLVAVLLNKLQMQIIEQQKNTE